MWLVIIKGVREETADTLTEQLFVENVQVEMLQKTPFHSLQFYSEQVPTVLSDRGKLLFNCLCIAYYKQNKL